MSDIKKELDTLRVNIDEVDKALIELFKRRMDISEAIAGVKRAGNISLVDISREKQVIDTAAESVEDELRGDVRTLMSTLIALSKRRQYTSLMDAEPALLPESRDFDSRTVAFQGVPGAWGEMAASTLYPDSEITAEAYFEDVFDAVANGDAGCGVLPIENSQTGAIGEVYDLLRKHGCYIVAQTWVDIRQCLLAKPGTRLEDIREVLSHSEGLRQCRNFLRKYYWDKTACRNTAAAAKTVSESEGNRLAAIGSRRAAQLYSLNVLAPDIMDSAANRTRFIAIAKNPCYNEKSDTLSVTFSTAHRSGALCSVLEVFMASGLNLSRIESRPAAGGRYRFFADLQANILDKSAVAALGQARAMSEYFEVLGCYNA